MMELLSLWYLDPFYARNNLKLEYFLDVWIGVGAPDWIIVIMSESVCVSISQIIPNFTFSM